MVSMQFHKLSAYDKQTKRRKEILLHLFFLQTESSSRQCTQRRLVNSDTNRVNSLQTGLFFFPPHLPLAWLKGILSSRLGSPCKLCPITPEVVVPLHTSSSADIHFPLSLSAAETGDTVKFCPSLHTTSSTAGRRVTAQVFPMTLIKALFQSGQTGGCCLYTLGQSLEFNVTFHVFHLMTCTRLIIRTSYKTGQI